MSDLKNTVINFLEKYNLTDKTIIVGFSGGHDSICLLDVISKISSEYKGITLIAAHFNHNWRGEESKAEQERCREYCKKNNIEFYTKTANVSMKKSEAVARAIRYDFFEKAMKDCNADALLTAHNKNDNAETVIYRVIKGTGITGLRGILPKVNSIYRPLLAVTRDEIDEYLKENDLIPNEDSSNNDTKYKRNFIRHKLIPMAKEINQNIVDSLNTLSMVSSDEFNIIDEYMKLIKAQIFSEKTLLTQKYLPLSNFVKRKIIYDLLVENDIDYDSEKIYNIYTFVEENSKSKSGKKISISKGVWLFVNEKIIEIVYKTEKNTSELNIRLEGEYEFGDYMFEITSVFDLPDKFPSDSKNFAYIDLSENDLDFVLRTRRDGDIINPLGMKGSMKLKKYLISKSVPQHKKDNLILLCKENEVFWVAGLGLSNKIHVTDKPTHKISIKHK